MVTLRIKNFKFFITLYMLFGVYFSYGSRCETIVQQMESAKDFSILKPQQRSDMYNENYKLPDPKELLKIKNQTLKTIDTMAPVYPIYHIKDIQKRYHDNKEFMDTFTLKKESTVYTNRGLWRVHRPLFLDFSLPKEGWIFHISAAPQSMKKIFQAIVPVLVQEDVIFKVLNNGKAIDRYIENIGKENEFHQGHFIRILPRTFEEAQKISTFLKDTIQKNELKPEDFINVPRGYEVSLGVFAWYAQIKGAIVEKKIDIPEVVRQDLNKLVPQNKTVEEASLELN